MKRAIIIGVTLLLTSLTATAQRYFNLTAQEVRVDTLLPVFTYHVPLGKHYADSTYKVSILYPEFIPMSSADVERYHRITTAALPALPEVSQVISVERKEGELTLSFVPLVCRDGEYQKLVSFMLEVKATAKEPARLQRYTVKAGATRAADATCRAEGGRYKDHSVLATGSWAKISVPKTGIYQLTSDVIRKAGFSDLSKVKIYGYGGALQPEVLTGDYIAATDDLEEVPTCEVGGRRLFYAVGPVAWNSINQRVRNPYSSYGYYFITESSDAPATVDEATFKAMCYPAAEYHNTLYEVDDFAWFSGGRNLYDATAFSVGTSRDYTLAANANTTKGTVTVALTAHTTGSGNYATADVAINGTKAGTMTIAVSGSYDAMRTVTQTFETELQATNTITITHTGGTNSTMRLDYIALHSDETAPEPDLTATYPAPAYVYNIGNQDHHADSFADMVIIIPTSQKLRLQAERLKTMHEQVDGLRVNIVPADELFNEFASGTPDANAYRRYLKMLYDRAETDDDMPRYLLLMGDGAWDNRMQSSAWSKETPDDFLLTYESENSYSKTDCYVTDDYFCLLDDGEGANMLTAKADAAVGRITARTADDAAIVVDKIINYVNDKDAGAWQNQLCFMGDDGNENAHMQDADSVARLVETLYPTYQVKRVMWDAYARVSSSTGNSYPDATRLIKQTMQQGALMMNYSGHGSEIAISHEYVLRIGDFENTSAHLPLWVTASCDIMPFDGQDDNIGETAMFNKNGGSVAFFGTTRTVYQSYNRLMNLAFVRHVLSKDDAGRTLPIGEAVRKAKNELIETGIITGYSDGRPVYSTDRTANKLQYTLLGDPAMRLAAPRKGITVDAINDVPLTSGQTIQLKAGATAKVTGHITEVDGQAASDFTGVVTATVQDVLEEIVCRQNDPAETSEPFVFYDRTNTLFTGSNQVKNGTFTFTFAVPKDISYSTDNGLISLYAISDDKAQKASGICEQIAMSEQGSGSQSTTGPSIYCYLNSTAFTNGDNVNPTPYFYAQLKDEDGINASGSGIGHDIQLIIDGEMAKTYKLNDYFQYDFGSYTSGTVGYSIPELSYGQHKLLFRAWDILNNSSTAELTFNVVKGLEPLFFDVECTQNPASTATAFRVIHDRAGSAVDIVLDVFDISGRHLWSHSETGVSTDNSYTVDWDLTVDGGRRLQTGVYLYRLRLSSDGSTYASKAKKLIILTHK